ncbi:MAG: CPBP family intramembrane metalloprotease [Planctomycetes bacterium]|nr:CPBP family intramembrane metalloprotease [Planctomycetota bacterium]
MPEFDPNFIAPLGWFHLIFFGLLIPYFAWKGQRQLRAKDAAPMDRMKHFRSAAYSLVLFGAFSIFTANEQWMVLFPRELPSLWTWAAGLAMYIAMVLVMRPRWRRAVQKRVRIVHLFMPDNAKQRAWWILVAVLAGVSEEITWRGVQTGLLTNLVGMEWAAMAICAAMFGLAHLVQGWKSVAIITCFALGFHGLVWLGGSLYVAMLAHLTYDIHAGLAYGRLGRELGYKLDAPVAPPHA